MLFTTGEVNDFGDCNWQVYLSWFAQLISVGTLHTKLSITVGSPGVELTILIDAHSVVNTTLYLDNVRQLLYLLREVNLIPVSMAKSTILSETPGVNFTIFSYTSCVLETASNILDLLACKFTSDKVNFIIFSIVLGSISSLLICILDLLLFLCSDLLFLMSKFPIIRITPRDTIITY